MERMAKRQADEEAKKTELRAQESELLLSMFDVIEVESRPPENESTTAPIDPQLHHECCICVENYRTAPAAVSNPAHYLTK
jgi:hypothetical protein